MRETDFQDLENRNGAKVSEDHDEANEDEFGKVHMVQVYQEATKEGTLIRQSGQSNKPLCFEKEDI